MGRACPRQQARQPLSLAQLEGRERMRSRSISHLQSKPIYLDLLQLAAVDYFHLFDLHRLLSLLNLNLLNLFLEYLRVALVLNY